MKHTTFRLKNPHKNPGGDAPSGTNQTTGGKVSPALAGGNPPPVQSTLYSKTAEGKPPTARGKPSAAGGKPLAPPKPLSAKDKQKLLSEKIPKRADDPFRSDNYYDCLGESMEEDITPPSLRKVHLPRITNTESRFLSFIIKKGEVLNSLKII